MGATAQQVTQNPPDPDLQSQDERLGQVLRIMTNADRRLMNIQAGWNNPPDGDKPETIALLNTLIDECSSIMDIANALLLDIPRG